MGEVFGVVDEKVIDVLNGLIDLVPSDQLDGSLEELSDPILALDSGLISIETDDQLFKILKE